MPSKSQSKTPEIAYINGFLGVLSLSSILYEMCIKGVEVNGKSNKLVAFGRR